MRKILLALILVALPATAQAYESMLTCTFRLTANTDDPRRLTPRVLDEPLVLMFANLDDDFPVLKGNVAEVPLRRLSESDDGVLYLAEQTPYGHLFYYTIYREQKMATYSKDFLLNGEPQSFKMTGACR